MSMAVHRSRGTFGTVQVTWAVTPEGQTDLTPTSGVLVFEEGVDSQNITLEVINEQVWMVLLSTTFFYFVCFHVTKHGLLNVLLSVSSQI